MPDVVESDSKIVSAPPPRKLELDRPWDRRTRALWTCERRRLVFDRGGSGGGFLGLETVLLHARSDKYTKIVDENLVKLGLGLDGVVWPQTCVANPAPHAQVDRRVLITSNLPVPNFVLLALVESHVVVLEAAQ